MVGYNAINRNEDITLLKEDCEDEIVNIVNSQQVEDAELEEDESWKNPDKYLEDQISYSMFSECTVGLKLPKMSLTNVETQLVFGLFLGDVNIQEAPGLYQEVNLTKEVHSIHLGDVMNQEIVQMEDMEHTCVKKQEKAGDKFLENIEIHKLPTISVEDSMVSVDVPSMSVEVLISVCEILTISVEVPTMSM